MKKNYLNIKNILPVLVIFFLHSGAGAQPLKIAVFQLEPFMMQDPYTGEISGITIRYWKEYIAPKLGVELEFIGLFPITRAISFLQDGTADVIPQLTKIPEREELFLYPDSELTSIVPCLILPSDSSIEIIDDPSDLFGMKIGFMHDAFIPEPLINPNITLELISNQDFRGINIRKLMAGRLDGVLDINYVSMKEYLNISGFGKKVKLVVLPFQEEPVYSIFRNDQKLRGYFKRFDEINAQGRADGVFEQMTQEYFNEELNTP